MSRLDLGDGQWAELRERYGWLPAARIQAVLMDGEGSEAFWRAVVRETLLAWHVLSVDGQWLDDTGEAAQEAVEGHTGERVLKACMAEWRRFAKARPDPKGIAAPSPSPPTDGA